MKNLFICLLFASLFSNSQTNVSGVIGVNTTWTKINSPYIITANTIVMPNITLNIQPGVEVKFMQNVQLSLRGKLNAIGTLVDSILFTSNSGTVSWNGVFVDNTSNTPKVNLKYFRGCYASSFFKVPSTNSASDTLIKVSNSVFGNNHIVFDINDSPKSFSVTIDSSNFYKRGYYDCQGASNLIIKNSKFYGANSPYGRALYNDSGQPTVIDNCEFIGFIDAALLVDGKVTNSKFFNNNIAICTMGTNDPKLYYNDIQGNYIGIEAWNYSTNPTNQIMNNKICNTGYNIKKVYTSDTYVQNNCWCSSDSGQISNTMYDFFHASNVGLVFFMPFKTNCNNISSVKIDQAESQTLKIFPNPTNGIFKIYAPMQNGIIKNTYSENYELIILNNIGKEIYYEKISQPETEIDVRKFNSGLYFVQLKNKNNVIAYSKLIVCQ